MKSLKSHLFSVGLILVSLCSHAWAVSANLPFGQVQTGTISSAAQSNSYTFSANLDDEIDFTMVTTSGTLVPKIQLYLGGTLFSTANPGYCSGSTIEMNTVQLPATGTYTVDVSDCSSTNTGNYALYAQRTNNPSGAASLPFAQTQTGTIGSAAQSNTYTFSANLDDEIDFTMDATSGSLSPRIRLYEPNGTLLSSASPGYCSGSTIEMNTVQIPATGTYTVVVGDCSDTNTGNYDIYTQRTDNPFGAASLPFGQTQTGSISSQAQDNTYTFSANLDDVINLTMVTTSGKLIPRIRLYEPNGTLLSSASPGYCSGSTIEMNTVQLPATGTYTVIVGDCSDTNTGNYDIYAQLTNNPSGASDLSFAQIESGTIGSAAQSNTYTFSANLNDEIDFTVNTSSGKLVPWIGLYEPNGTKLSSANPGYCSGSTIEMNTVQIPATGTYTVLVADCSDTNTGNYEIYAQRTDNPSGAANLPFGQVQTGSISSQAQDNTYTFSANANDVVGFTMVTTSGELIPRVRLYNPNGTLLSSASPGYCSGSTIEMNAVQLPASGVYTVLVGDCSDTNTGNYDIYAQRTNNPSGASMLLFAQTQNGLIGSAAQYSTYTFSANSDDVVNFTVVATSGKLVPWIGLYEPNGTKLSSANPGYCSGSTVEMNAVQVPATGTYTVLIDDCNDTNTGNYVIYAQSTNNPFGPTPVLWGQVQTGTIGSAALSNTYTFSGTTNNSVNLTMTTTSGSLTPRIRLYEPNGTLLTSANPGYCSGSTTQLSSVTLPLTGTYTVLVGDCNDTNTGKYNLSSQCFGTCPTTPTITWTTPSPISYGTALGATQLDASASVAGTFTYSPAAGTVLPAGPQKLSTTFTPSDTTDYATTMDYVQLMVTVPVAGVSPGSLTFNNQGVGTTSAASTVTVTNNATASLTFTSIKVTGDFALASGTTCSTSTPVAGSGNCVFNVTFTPLAIGNLSGTLTITDNSNGVAGSQQTVSLNGVGVGPYVELSPPSMGFIGLQVVGTSSAPQSVTLTNTGNASLTLNSLTLTGANSGDFSLSQNCPGTLAAGSSCTLTGTFKPTAGGPRKSSISISDNAARSPQTLLLTGTGTAVSLSPGSLNFAAQTVRTTSSSQQITVTNKGSATVTFFEIAIGGANPGDFSKSSTCGSTLAPAATCAVNVTFTPTETGSRTASVLFSDNGGGNLQSVALTGSGQ
jgi:predicted secreted protein